MSECSGAEGLLSLLFFGGFGTLLYFIIRSIEKPDNKQPEPENNKKEKTYGTKAHIGSKVCVERKVGRADCLGYWEYEYKAEVGTIIGKRTSYYGGIGNSREFWLVQFEDGKVEEYDYYQVYTEYSEDLVKAKKQKSK